MKFNGDVSKWDTSKVSVMTDMFKDASSFKGDLSTWDVGKVRESSGMFLRSQASCPFFLVEILRSNWLEIFDI